MAHVQSDDGAGAGSAQATLTSVAAGSTILVFGSVENEARTLTCTDDKGNIYTTHRGPLDHPGTDHRAYIFASPDVVAGTTVVTVQADSGTPDCHIAAGEYSGRDDTSPVEATNDGANSSTTNHTGGSVTASEGADVVAAVLANADLGGCTPGAGFLERIDNQAQHLQDDLNVSAGSYGPGTVVSTNSRNSWTLIASLAAPSAAPTPSSGTYDEFIAAGDRDEQVVVWLEPRLVLTGWTLTPSQSNTYDVAMPAQVGAGQVGGGVYRRVVGVRENGTDLTERTSIATVEASASSWWWDAATGELYVHSSTGSDPDTFTTYQAIVRFHLATKPVRLEDGTVSLYHHPWLTGGLPTLYERDDQDVIAAKLTRRSVLEVANGSGWWQAITAHDGAYRWENSRARFKLGGSYDRGSKVLPLSEYADLATMLVANATAGETVAAFECMPFAGFLANQTLPSNPFFETTYPNLGQGVSGKHEWVGYGRAIVLADLVDTVTSEGVWRTAEGVTKAHRVWAVSRETGVRTLLNPLSPDVHYLGNDSIQVLDSTYNWQTHWIEADVEGRQAPNGNRFAPIAKDLLQRYLGVQTADFDLLSMLDAIDLAPQTLRVWLKKPRSVTSILTTTQEGFPSLEGSTLGRVGQTADGLWTFGVFTPTYDATAIPSLRPGDFAAFDPVPASRQPVNTVNVYYNARHVADRSGNLATEYDVETVTAASVGWENDVPGKTLDLHTFLVEQTDAKMLGYRVLLLAGPQRAEVEVELTGLRAVDMRVGDPLLVTYSPAPCVSGAYDRAAFEFLRTEHRLGPRARQRGRLTNLRGLAGRAGRWQPDSLPAYASATEFERTHRGYWTNDSDEAAPGDAESKRSRWW